MTPRTSAISGLQEAPATISKCTDFIQLKSDSKGEKGFAHCHWHVRACLSFSIQMLFYESLFTAVVEMTAYP